MQSLLKFGLVFVGGIVFGAIAKKAFTENDAVRNATTDLLSRGVDVKNCVMNKVETMKETAEDLMAEAQSVSEKRRQQEEKVVS